MKGRIENKERQTNKRKCRQENVELLSRPDTPRVVKPLRLFGVSHRAVSSADKHGTVAVKNRCLGSLAQLARMFQYYTGLKLARHSIP
jgi:hypothetical protein